MLRRLFQITTGALAGLAVVGLASLLGWLPGGSSGDADPYLLPGPFPAPDLRMTSHSGEPFELSASGGPAVVFFGYTHCPDVCPLTLANLRRAVDSLGDTSASVRVLFVTVDPARDTRERLRDYLAPFQPGFTGLTGAEAEVSAAASDWGIFRDVPGGAEPTVDHTARSFVVDGTGRVRATFPPDTDSDTMSRTLRSLFGP